MVKFIRQNPVLELTHDAYPYQKEAFESIKDMEFAGIFHEQGLGKTKIAIDLLCYWLEQDRVDSVLVITKKTLVQNWVREIKMHTQIETDVFTSNKRKNHEVFTSTSYLYIAHYQVLNTDKEAFKKFLKARRVAVILDESAAIKNRDSQLARTYHELAKLMDIRIIMSGTPFANKPQDIWSQIYFLDSGENLGKDYPSFEEQYYFPREDYLKHVFAKSLVRLNESLQDFTIRETKESAGINLPNKEYVTLMTDFAPEQLEIYDEAKKTMSLELEQDGEIKFEDLEWILIRMIRLVQITSHPALVQDQYDEMPGKMLLLKENVSEILESDLENKIIIWTSFIKNTESISEALMPYRNSIVHGRQSDGENQESIDRFLEDDQIRLFIATPQKAGEGLTLTVANHAFFYDRSFSLQHYLQAQDRIHRISQDRICYIYNLMIRDSIDEYIDKLVKAKHVTSQLAIGDISEEEFLDKGHFDLRKTLDQILS
jgi:SNF2 family DNA or RNA helicase